MENKFKIISHNNNNGNYEFNLYCNIHNINYTVNGNYKHCKAVLGSFSCGCPMCNLTKTESKQFRNNFGENTPERKKMIKDLIDTYNIKVDNGEDENDVIDNDNENDINTDIETKVNDIDDEIYDDIDDENELKPYKEIKDLGELLDKDFDETLFSTGDKWNHIMSKEISRIWNNVLRDNENHNENTINEIHQKLINNSLTKFEKYVYEEFLKEYEEVINLEIH